MLTRMNAYALPTRYSHAGQQTSKHVYTYARKEVDTQKSKQVNTHIRKEVKKLTNKEVSTYTHMCVGGQASEGMAVSKFCLHIRGDTGSSCRLFDAIARLCVPVIVSDFADLPFEDELRYTHFALFFPEEVGGGASGMCRVCVCKMW